MRITRTFKNGKWEPPFTPEEEAANAARFAEMCASRQGTPTLGSERTFMAEVGFRDHGFADHPKWLQEILITRAKAAGINVEGKRYFGGLADGRGVCDPGAWCATQQDYIDEANRKDLIVHSGSGLGGVNRGHNDEIIPMPEGPKLAPDIVNRLTNEYRARDPQMAQKPVQEVKEMVIEKHGRRPKNRPIPDWKPDANFKDFESEP